jgi:hypothetical protein
VDLDEVVGEVSEGHGCDVVLDLFREGIRQAGEAAVRHPHAEERPVTGRLSHDVQIAGLYRFSPWGSF